LYASPQQLHGEDPDPRDDVHALGVIWVQMLTGDTTVGVSADWKDDLAEYGVPEGAIRVLGACLAAKQDRRLASAAVLVEELRRLMGSSAKRVMPTAARPGEVISNSLGMKFAWIPPGTFLMGSPSSEQERGDDET